MLVIMEWELYWAKMEDNKPYVVNYANKTLNDA